VSDLPFVTEVLPVDKADPDPISVTIAAAHLRSGELVAFPTETVYGLGADATNAEAVAKIFAAKQRPASDPLIVHISGPGEMDNVAVDIPPLAHTLAEAFWPGPLTLVLRRADAIPAIVSAGLDTVAVRLPAHPVAIALIREAGKPLAAPSANLFSRPSPTRAEHVYRDLAGRVKLILDAGPADVGVESTVVDLTVDPPAVLRPGGVTLEALREIAPRIVYAARNAAAGEAVSSPGMLLKHYSPRAEVRLFTGRRDAVLARMRKEISEFISLGKTVGALALSEDAPSLDAATDLVDLGSGDRLDDVSRKLFDAMRRLDDCAADVIFVRAPDRNGLGEAIWDRLYRAAEGRVFEVE
jgi:L-threonylcarbamoyladenylate synthase